MCDRSHISLCWNTIIALNKEHLGSVYCLYVNLQTVAVGTNITSQDHTGGGI